LGSLEALSKARAFCAASNKTRERFSLTLERGLFLKLLTGLRGGQLKFLENGRASLFGQEAPDRLVATLEVRDPAFYRDAVLGGEVGMGEAYMAGHWSSPDLVSLVRLAVRNADSLDQSNAWLSWLPRTLNRLRHLMRSNTKDGSRENIRRHYDLSNDFFSLWLDPSWLYSSALWRDQSESLTQAQFNKIDRACSQVGLGPNDHLLEIGSGWGSLAIHAAERYGCQVTTTTISRQQFELAEERIARAGLQGRIRLLLEDYRDLKGRFDKALSIEMFEAVGFQHYDAFFSKLTSLLHPGSPFLIQTITMNDRRFPSYIQSTDWIQKYIFPGGELSSVLEIEKSLARTGNYRLDGRKDFGLDYARTLHHWREEFHRRIEDIRRLGFDRRFERMWDYYLAYCEGAFLERYIGVSQLRFVPGP
jgi:cyclopropane-fatty-acyl-phospholipid synthase